MDANEENALLLAQVKKNTYSPDPIKEAVEDIAFGSVRQCPVLKMRFC